MPRPRKGNKPARLRATRNLPSGLQRYPDASMGTVNSELDSAGTASPNPNRLGNPREMSVQRSAVSLAR